MTRRPEYDAVVIGAGPAGAVAARELARAGRSVLLVDKATFPRRKVCGCCLNGNALAALASVGLGELPARLGAVPLHSLRLAAGGRMATVPLSGVSLSRDAFDVALIREAVAEGVEFIQGCKATLGLVEGVGREVGLEFLASGGRKPPVSSIPTGGLRPPLATTVLATIVLVADGLNGRTAATADGFDVPATASSRIGAGVVLTLPPPAFTPGTIFMATGTGGYVGLVVLEDGRLDLAAAFDPAFVRASSGLGEAAATTMAEAGFPVIPGLPAADWKGTPALTRTPDRLAGERWLAVGDAAGYVEPFTGEGMAWAVGGAAAAARLVAGGWNRTLPAEWTRIHRRLIGRRQWLCRLLAPLLRSRLLRRMMVTTLRAIPGLASPVVHVLNRPPART